MSKDKKSNSKRVKINFDSFSAPSAKKTEIKIDWGKHFEDKKIEKEKAMEKYLEDIKNEEERIEKLCCPICKTSNKKRFITADSNGIMGPGYNSIITNDYFICQSCGIHFSDLNKKEIKKPDNYFLF